MSTVVEPIAAPGAFSAPPHELSAAADGVLLARLDELAHLRVHGADAVAFLQSQLTNDVAHLAPDALQPTGYCTPKGRLLATFRQWRDGEAIVLQLPRDLAAGVRKRLSMYVLRSQVRIDEAPLAAFGLVGPQAARVLAAAGAPVPAAPWSAVVHDGVRIARLPEGPRAAERFLLVADAAHDVAAWLGQPPAGSGAWWWSEIDAAVPTVFAATQEKFVPQMINYEVLGGVNFRKGCYPGQEVVARSQYLGKLRRRMRPAHAAGDAPPAAGGDVLAAGEPLGTIVLAAQAPGGGIDLLVELPHDASGPLALADGRSLAVRELPYALTDPTA